MSANPVTVAITDLADVNPPLSASRPRPFEQVSFIPMADVSDSGEWVNRQSRRLAEIGAGYTPFQEHDVLFAKITPCMENGKGALAVGLEHGIGFGSTEFHVLRAKPGNEPRFMYHVSRWDMLRRKAESMMIGSAGQQRVAAEFFSHFRITFLNGDRQRRIADILDASDRAIRQTEAVIAKLRQMKAGLLHDLLTRGLDERGRLRDPAAHPEQFKDSPLGRIPKTWRTFSFGQLADYINGGAFNENDWKTQGIPIIRIQNLNGNTDFNYFSGSINPRWEVKAGDLLFAWSGTRDTSFGPRIWSGPRGILNQHIFKVVPDSELVGTEFLNELLHYYLPEITASAHGFKSSFVHVKREELTSVVVPVPQTNEQDQIGEVIRAHANRVAIEEANRDKLKLQKRGLMLDLLTGRVRV